MEKHAVISDCEKYRYWLSRIWDNTLPPVVFVMLNPSTADASIDDPTIRRCVGFAKDWGFGSLIVVNLFAFRATNPKDLLTSDNPIGEENIQYLQRAFTKSQTIICAWGNSGIVTKIMRKVKGYEPLKNTVIENLQYIDLSNDGTPKHPLYLPSVLEPKRFLVQRKKLPFTTNPSLN